VDDFARRPAADRRAFIEEAAARRDLTAIIIEKDFWVCWTLRRLARSAEISGHLTFKGGTSLSKAFGIIERFSEDIDLTISRHAPIIEAVHSPMVDGISNNERQRRTKALKVAAQAYVAKIAHPILERDIELALGTKEDWSIALDAEDPDQQTLLFNYPRTLGLGGAPGNDSNAAVERGYIKPRIKLEFGARGEAEPFEMRALHPYLADDFPDQLPDAVTEVATLAIERSYWEKITILHALNHNGKLRQGMSRHYYDVLMLDRAGITAAALKLPDLLVSVVRNKSLLFTDNTASYATAKLGTMRLSPTGQTLDLLTKDYAAMTEMFMAAPPSLNELVAGLADLEATLNAAHSP
jgi:hypothetical protein